MLGFPGILKDHGFCGTSRWLHWAPPACWRICCHSYCAPIRKKLWGCRVPNRWCCCSIRVPKIHDAPGLVSSTAATVRYYLRSPTKNLLRGARRYDSSPHLESSLHRRGAGRCCSNPFPHLRANTLNLGGAARCYSIPNTRQTMTCWASESEANGEEANYTIRSAGQNI